MKNRILIMVLAAFLFSNSARAQGHVHGDHHQAAKPVAGGEVKTLEEGYAALQTAANAKAFEKVHEIVERMEPALKSIGTTHRDDAGIRGTTEQLGKVLHALHEAGDKKDAEGVGTQLKKLGGGLKLLKSRISHDKSASVDNHNTVRLSLSPAEELEAGKSLQVVARLTRVADGGTLGENDLKVAHTQRLHLLIIDPTLMDYHHVHPVAGEKSGEFVFDFLPAKNTTYRVWADIIPLASGKQEFVIADLGKARAHTEIDRTPTSTASVGGYNFELTLDGEPTAGKAVLGTIIVKDKEGKPFKKLEPVMGAFAHVVGFEDDYKSIMHIHPMGEEPNDETARGGPELKFHMEPQKSGFIKLFAQVRIGGKDLFAPFGLLVK